MKNKLISMTERVIYEMSIFNNACYVDDYSALNLLKEKLEKHALFLLQKLEIWMFVPCKLVEGVWVVLEEPEEKSFYTEMSPKNGRRRWKTNSDKYTLDLCEYQEAKERVLFEGFTAIYNQTKNGTVAIVRNTPNSLNIELGFKNTTCKFKTIEDLVKYDLILTPTAQKQIGL